MIKMIKPMLSGVAFATACILIFPKGIVDWHWWALFTALVVGTEARLQ